MLGSDTGNIAVEEVSCMLNSVVTGGIEDVCIGIKLSSGEEDPGYRILISNVLGIILVGLYVKIAAAKE